MIRTVFSLSNLRSQFRNPKIKGQCLIVTTNDKLLLDLTSFADEAKIQYLTPGTVLGMVGYRDGSWKHIQTSQVFLPNNDQVCFYLEGGTLHRFNGYIQLSETPQTQNELESLIRDRVQKMKDAGQFLLDTPEILLETMLNGRDWYAAFSDAPGTFGAWESQWTRCCVVARKCNPMTAISLYHQYAPGNYERKVTGTVQEQFNFIYRR